MYVYTVERSGVYQQGLVGIFTTKELAEEYAVKAKAAEKDDYHTFTIDRWELNKAVTLLYKPAWATSPNYVNESSEVDKQQDL